MANRLRVGVIGCGAIAQIMHIPYIVEYDEKFELVALADAYKPILDAVVDRYGVSNRYTDWREMVKRPDIDAVVVAHSGSHHATVIGALNAGKHVFVEKPLAWTMREVEDIAECVKSTDRTVQ